MPGQDPGLPDARERKFVIHLLPKGGLAVPYQIDLAHGVCPLLRSPVGFSGRVYQLRFWSVKQLLRLNDIVVIIAKEQGSCQDLRSEVLLLLEIDPILK